MLNLKLRLVFDTGISSVSVVPIKELRNVIACCDHTVVSLEVNPFKFDSTPQPLEKHIVTPCTLAIHRALELSTIAINSVAVNWLP